MKTVYEYEYKTKMRDFDDDGNEFMVDMNPEPPFNVGDIVYPISSENFNLRNRVTKTRWELSKTIPTTNMRPIEQPNGWLGATCGDGWQTDRHSHGEWVVAQIDKRHVSAKWYDDGPSVQFVVTIAKL